MPPIVYESDWGMREYNLMIKQISVVDDKGRSVVFERVQKNSNSHLSWYNIDYPVMDEYLDTWSLMVKYDAYNIIGFYEDGKQPPHVCGYKNANKCPTCVKPSGAHLHLSGMPAKPKYKYVNPLGKRPGK